MHSKDIVVSDLRIKSIIASVDGDKDGQLDFKEFLKLMELLELQPRDREDELSSMFDFIDVDKSGFITASELNSFMKNEKDPLTSKDIDVIMLEYDLDRDGQLNFDEFKKWMVSVYFLTISEK